MIHSKSGSLWDIPEQIDLFILRRRFPRPKTNCWIGSRSWWNIFFRRFVPDWLTQFFLKISLACIFHKGVSSKGIIVKGTGAVCCDFGWDELFWLNRLMRLNFFTIIFLDGTDICPEIVVTRPWYLIAFVLACISEIDLLRDSLDLILLFGPLLFNSIVVGRRTTWFLLLIVDLIKICFLFCSSTLKRRLLIPNRLMVATIYIVKIVLAGPGEQLSLIRSLR